MDRVRKLVIVGGVAGGATAAARARRLDEQVEIVVFERGPHVSFANCGLPYHVGEEIPEREQLLLQSPESLRARYRLDVRVRHEVLSIDREAHSVRVRDLAHEREFEEPYDKLLLAPGAAPVRPPLPGIDDPRLFTLRDVPDSERIKRAVDGGARRAVVVGGGFIGLEMVENLRRRGLEVALVEMLDQVMPPLDPEMAAPVHEVLRAHGVALHLGDAVTAFVGEDDALEVRLRSGLALPTDLVVLAIGVRPEVTLAKDAGLEIGEHGGIRVDSEMRTSDPDIYAVGDAVEVEHCVVAGGAWIPLAGPANRQARIAVGRIFGRSSRYGCSQGTAIVRVFDTTVACTGASEKLLRARGLGYEKVYVHPAHHASYFPGAQRLSIKLLFDPRDGRILGGQIVGGEGVDKRIDVLATAIHGEMTVHDLEELELAYAPPFGAAKDPLHMAGFVATNVLKGDVAIVHADRAGRDGRQLVDVRTPQEFARGHIPGARNVPLDALRERLSDLPREQPLTVYCQVGLRGYVAARILNAHGYDVRNLAGGYTTYRAFHPATDPSAV